MPALGRWWERVPLQDTQPLLSRKPHFFQQRLLQKRPLRSATSSGLPPGFIRSHPECSVPHLIIWRVFDLRDLRRPVMKGGGYTS